MARKWHPQMDKQRGDVSSRLQVWLSMGALDQR